MTVVYSLILPGMFPHLALEGSVCLSMGRNDVRFGHAECSELRPKKDSMKELKIPKLTL